jgi:hypothetical protein
MIFVRSSLQLASCTASPGKGLGDLVPELLVRGVEEGVAIAAAVGRVAVADRALPIIGDEVEVVERFERLGPCRLCQRNLAIMLPVLFLGQDHHTALVAPETNEIGLVDLVDSPMRQLPVAGGAGP